jgi:hypothetical protein
VTSTTQESSEFGRGIALTPRQPGSYDAFLDAGWQVAAGVNGGLLLAVLGNALRDTLGAQGHPDPLAISAFYLSASRPGSATVRTAVLRRGRSMSTGTASLVQDEDGAETERIRATATYGDLGALPAEVRTTTDTPDLPPPERCVAAGLAPADFAANVPILDRLDLRLDPTCVGWALGEPSGRGLLQGWLRLADGREPDPLMLLLAVDALPPAAFDLGVTGWTPTLELTAYVRAVPAPGWLRIRISTSHFAGGFLEEDAEVWDSRGRLVAQSRQLARAPR